MQYYNILIQIEKSEEVSTLGCKHEQESESPVGYQRKGIV